MKKADNNMSAAQAWEMRAHFFAYMDKDKHGNYIYWKGAQGGFEWLVQQPGMDWLQIEVTDDPRKFSLAILFQCNLQEIQWPEVMRLLVLVRENGKIGMLCTSGLPTTIMIRNGHIPKDKRLEMVGTIIIWIRLAMALKESFI